MEENSKQDLSALTAEVVTAYVSNHNLRPDDLPGLITEIHIALKRAPAAFSQRNPPPQEPAVPLNKAIMPDYVVCLEDGKKFKSLKRHLSGVHGLTPEDYRAKWGLPRGYPMAAPNYSKSRSALAKQLGLGRKAPAGAAGPSERPSEHKTASARRKRAQKNALAKPRKRPNRARSKS